jgi:hypothetical protein
VNSRNFRERTLQPVTLAARFCINKISFTKIPPRRCPFYLPWFTLMVFSLCNSQLHTLNVKHIWWVWTRSIEMVSKSSENRI